MHSTGLLGAAVANNASWCDAVCRSHGYPGTFSTHLWASTRHRLRFYPNAITLDPEVTAPEVLAAAAPDQPFAVKDSFARLDLAPAGFRLLAEDSWIVSEPRPDVQEEPPDGGLSFGKITDPGELTAWETAWSGGDSSESPLFQPGLLADPRCSVLASGRERTIEAGAIVYAADGAAGVANLFSTGSPQDQLWTGMRRALADLYPHLPIVGYEQGASLAAARLAGFHVLGTLRIWARQ